MSAVGIGCGTVLASPSDSEDSPVRPRDDGAIDAGAGDDGGGDAAEAAEAMCPSRLACGGTDVGADGELVTIPARLCLEACLRIAYDPSGFGDAGTDFVKMVDVGLVGETERAGGFNIGVARMPYVFADGLSQDGFNVLQWPSGFPRERWFHLRLDVRYGTSPNAELFVDGALVTEGAVPPFRVDPKTAVLTRGPLASGVHPVVDLRFEFVRLTRY